MIRKNNKRLYESIMKDVSKKVKKHLNEYEVGPNNYIIRITAQDDNNNCITIFEKKYSKNIQQSFACCIHRVCIYLRF